MCDAALPLVNSTLFSCPNFLSREFWNLVFHATPRCGAVSSSMYGDGLTPITFSDGLGVGPADVQVQRFKYYGAAQFFPHFMRPRCCTGGPTIYGDGRYGLSGYGVPKTVLMMDTVTPRSCRRPCEGRQGRGGQPASRPRGAGSHRSTRGCRRCRRSTPGSRSLSSPSPATSSAARSPPRAADRSP